MNRLRKIIKSMRDYSPWASDSAVLQLHRKDVASHRRRDRALLSERNMKPPFSGYPLPLAGDSSAGRILNTVDNKILNWWLFFIVFLAFTLGSFFTAYTGVLSVVTALLFLAAARQTAVWWPGIRRMRQGLLGERLVAEYLNNSFRDGMKGTVRVYHDIPFGTANIDHVVLCNQGIFVLNTKTMNLLKDAENTLVYRGDLLYFKKSGKPLIYDPVSQMNKEIARFRKLLRDCHNDYYRNKRGYKEPVIRGVVVYPGWQIEEDGEAPVVWVMPPDELAARISKEAAVMDDALVKHYAGLLSRWTRRTVNLIDADQAQGNISFML